MTPTCPDLIALTLAILLVGCGGDAPGTTSDKVYYQAYKIDPEILDSNELKKEDTSDDFPKRNQTIHDFVNTTGVDFHSPNSGVITGLGFSGFGMRNTSRNHEILARALDERFPGKWTVVDADNATQTPPPQRSP